MTDPTSTRAAVADVHELIARIDSAWRDFLDVLDGIPDDRLSEAGAVGEWSVKDLYGHIAFWDEQAIIDLDRALAGQPERDIDWQAMNDQDYVQRRERPAPEQRSDMHQAHAALLERLNAIAGIDAAPIDAAIKGASYEHYQEHIPDIKAWRERAGV